MSQIVNSPPLELIGNGTFDDASIWTLYDFTTINGGVMDIFGIMTSQGGGFQTIVTKKYQLYQFSLDITLKAGDPLEGIRFRFGTGGASVVSPLWGSVATWEWLVADPDGTGLVSVETFPNFDDNEMHIDNVSCKLYADLLAEDLDFNVPADTISETQLLPGNQTMTRLVNQRSSINNLYIVDL